MNGSVLQGFGTGRAPFSSQAAFTLVETLVAMAMSLVLLFAVTALITSSVTDQPQISQKNANIQTARWVLERLTREIRLGASVESATSSSVSFQTYVRRPTCGGSGTLAATSPATRCEVTYTVTGGTLSRIEANPNVFTGTPETVVSGLSNSAVFSYTPTSVSPTYINVTLTLPNATGTGNTTINDGATLSNATLTN
jgi:type II secretory pathway pseudopilin PulG